MKKLSSTICDVCRVILNHDYQKPESSFSDLCEKHNKYAQTYLIDIVSENLGFKDIQHDRPCEVCKKTLTNDEVQNSLQMNSFHFLCKKHLNKYSHIFMIPTKNTNEKNQHIITYRGYEK